MSEDNAPMTMVDKIVSIQHELKAHKGQYNNFGNYAYRSCEDILEALKPLLHKNSLMIYLTDNIVQIGERIYLQSKVVLTDGSTVMETTAYAREPDVKKGMDESQITGAASSYARKYALNGMFAIDDSEDADSTNDHAEGSDLPAKCRDLSTELAKNGEKIKKQIRALYEEYKQDPKTLYEKLSAMNKQIKEVEDGNSKSDT